MHLSNIFMLALMLPGLFIAETNYFNGRMTIRQIIYVSDFSKFALIPVSQYSD